MKLISILAPILLIVGGLNWGLVGAANFDLVAAIFGAGSVLANIVYIVVGIAAVLMVVAMASQKSQRA